MTDRVIVTVKECCCNREIDMELPVNQKAECIVLDIMQALTGYMPELVYKTENIFLVNKRTSKSLNPDKTLYEEGVRNGDIIVMLEAERRQHDR